MDYPWACRWWGRSTTNSRCSGWPTCGRKHRTIGARCLHSRPEWTPTQSLAAALGGAALVVATGHGVQIDGVGVAFALGSSFAFALYLMGADLVLKETNSLAGAMWVSGSAAGGLAIYAVVSGAGKLPHGWHQWGPVLGTAAVSAGAFFLPFAGLRRR